MEENERYRDREVSTETDYYTSIYDTEKNIDFFDEDIIPLLNQQDKEIKRLINLNKEVIIQNKNILNDAKEIEQENQQLKEENGYIIFSDGYDKNGNVVRKQEFVKYKDKFNELVKENRQLKSRLNLLKKYQQ